MRSIEPRGVAFRFTGLLVLAGLLAGCGGASTAVRDAAGAPIVGESAPGAMPAASGAPAEMPAGVAPAEVPSAAGSGSTGSDGTAAIAQDELRIVYTGTLELVVPDMAQALARAKTAVAAAGGYIGASQESNAGDRPTATITYRIPASRWEDAITAVRAVATKVVAEQTQASEVGGQIVDLEARIANLRASEAALQDIAKATARVTDLLAVQAQLTDVRGQIEQLDAQRARLADQVAYGTLVTTFGLEVAAVQETARGWDPAKDVDGATATLIGAGQALASAAIWFAIVWVPALLVLAVLAFVAWRLWRRLGRRRGGGPGADGTTGDPSDGGRGAIDGWNAA
jgi:hypothetical protein